MGVRAACRHVELSSATYYRSQRPAVVRPKKQRRPNKNRFPAEERARIHAIMNSERFQDMPPRQIYATLLDEGEYLCHWRTMYAILKEYNELRERRNQLVHPPYKKPELLATAPNQVWSWDTTKLRGPRKWTHYTLFVMLDIFSRYVVGWMVVPGESADLAREFINATCARQGISEHQLVIHCDRGAPMMSKTYTQLLADLGVRRSFSRPYQSNDNAFSEAQFKTMKYSAGYPHRFGSLQDARNWARQFMAWYNDVHYHSELALMRPCQVHYGKAHEVRSLRQRVMERAYAENPKRFLRGKPRIAMPPRQAWINKPKSLCTTPSGPEGQATSSRQTHPEPVH